MKTIGKQFNSIKIFKGIWHSRSKSLPLKIIGRERAIWSELGAHKKKKGAAYKLQVSLVLSLMTI